MKKNLIYTMLVIFIVCQNIFSYSKTNSYPKFNVGIGYSVFQNMVGSARGILFENQIRIYNIFYLNFCCTIGHKSPSYYTVRVTDTYNKTYTYHYEATGSSFQIGIKAKPDWKFAPFLSVGFILFDYVFQELEPFKIGVNKYYKEIQNKNTKGGGYLGAGFAFNFFRNFEFSVEFKLTTIEIEKQGFQYPLTGFLNLLKLYGFQAGIFYRIE